MEIRERIIRTLSTFDIIFDNALIDEIEQDVKRQKPKNSDGLAYIISRNKASTKMRKEISIKRKQAKVILKAEKERQQQIFFEAAKIEFWNVAQKALMYIPHHSNSKAHEFIFLLWFKIFEKESIIAIQKKFPTKSLVAIRKGIERGRLLIKDFAPPRLWKIVSKGMHSKQCK